MTIDDLIELAPPPARPVSAVGDWSAVEAALGLGLPADYKALVSRYGLGLFHDVTVLTPFDTHPEGWANLLAVGRDLLDDYGPLRDEFPEDFAYPLFPEPGGLLPWAGDGNGARMCWLTSGPPDQWPVVVWSPCEYADQYAIGAVEFLLAYLTGQPRIERPQSPAPLTPYFDSHRERSHVYVRLSDGEMSYEQRLSILRERLSPTADRGAYAHKESRQDHFKAVEQDWLLTYETAYGHQIRVAFPPEDDDTVRAVILSAVHAMGCEVLRTTNHLGAPAWGSPATGDPG